MSIYVPDIWPEVVLGVSVMVVLDEAQVYISRLSKKQVALHKEGEPHPISGRPTEHGRLTLPHAGEKSMPDGCPPRTLALPGSAAPYGLRP